MAEEPSIYPAEFSEHRTQGEKLGIIGYGNIGRAVAEMARGFGLEVLIAARPGSGEPIPPGRSPLKELFRQADVITLHCPLTPQTKNLINAETLSLMKPTALLVNTARGALIDETALIRSLRERRLAAAALDVISREPPPADHPIVQAAKESRESARNPAHGLERARDTRTTAWGSRREYSRFF